MFLGIMALHYFGYGANRDPGQMEAITGRSLKGQPAYVKGFELVVQKLGDIPELPQKILRKAWGKHFESYAIRKGEGQVHGMLWEITPEDRGHISNWELIPEGWYKGGLVTAILEDETEVPAVTDIIERQQHIDKVVDGSQYETFLMEKERMREHAIRDRE